VQFTAQRGLIDDPGGFGFVIQRGAINRDQVAVGAGLPVGDDDVGMQARIDPSPKFANAMLRTTNPSISAGKPLVLECLITSNSSFGSKSPTHDDARRLAATAVCACNPRAVA